VAWLAIPWKSVAVALLCFGLAEAGRRPLRWPLAFAILETVEIGIIHELSGPWRLTAIYAAASWLVVLVAWGASRHLSGSTTPRSRALRASS
jgi:hypothetical protein